MPASSGSTSRIRENARVRSALGLSQHLEDFRAIVRDFRRVGIRRGCFRSLAIAGDRGDAPHQLGLLGMLHTTWMPFQDFSAAYWHDGPASVGAQESALCFKEVMQRAKQE